MLPSLKVPVAVNCTVTPRAAMVGMTGVTTIDSRVASVTFRLVEVVMDPKLAVIMAVPINGPGALAKPIAFTVTILFEEDVEEGVQITAPVRIFVLPSS